MKKRIIGKSQPVESNAQPQWLDVTDLVEVEITSEDSAHPIESALLQDGTSGWRASEPGSQTIRLLFTTPQAIERIFLHFVETEVQRTQEYVLRWSADQGLSFKELVRQQWNFSPDGTTSETENYHVHLPQVTVLELEITPNISGGDARASVAQFRMT